MTLDELWDKIKNEDLPVKIKSKTKDCIVFFAFGQERSKYLLRLYLKNNNNLTIASENGKTSLQRRNEQIDENQPENIIVNTVKKWLTDASVAFKNDPLNKAGKKKKISLSSTPTVQQAGREGCNESEEKIIKTVLGKSAPDGEFWKDENYNPWIKPIYHKEDEIKTFILEDDWKIDNFKDFIWRPGSTETQIRANVLPQPYIGDPNAPIWILTMNPSYSEMDVFDLVNEDDGVTQVNALYPNCELNRGMLDKRRTLIKAQNSFDFDKLVLEGKDDFDVPWFYVLDKNFHTIRVPAGNKHGSYEWWNSYLLSGTMICGGNKENLKNFFVLESFPYHSKNFDTSDFFEKVVPKVKHYDFWRVMIKHALKENKILLCRGDAIAKRVAEIAKENKITNADTEQIFEAINWRSFWISMNNFVPYAAHENNEQEKQKFRNIILRKLNR